jgi:hypothetical protein
MDWSPQNYIQQSTVVTEETSGTMRSNCKHGQSTQMIDFVSAEKLFQMQHRFRPVSFDTSICFQPEEANLQLKLSDMRSTLVSTHVPLVSLAFQHAR